MKRRIRGVVASSAMLLSSAAAVAAQGSRVIITVTQSNMAPAAGAAVCFSSLSNTKLADANGIVTFDNTPAGQWSAVAWKNGFRARRGDISVSGTTDATARIALAEPSTEASPCVLPTVTLIAFVRDSNGRELPAAQVCVGTPTSVAAYAPVKTASTGGRAIFSNLPLQRSYVITASKGGYRGDSAVVALTAGATSASTTMQLPTGSGGLICPGASTAIDATSSTALPADQLPDLDLHVSQSSNPLVGGTRQTYLVKAYNRGGKSASAIVVRNSISGDLTHLLTDSNNGFVCTRSGTTVNCSSPALAAGDSARIRIETWLSSGASSGHDILFGTKADPNNTIAESNETNNQAAAATITQAAPPRLAEESLASRGDFNVSAGGVTQLDCKQFGDSLVMVGISGWQGQAINQIKVGCSPMKAPGVLSTSVRWTNLWPTNDGGGNRFDRPCPPGSAVSGVDVSVSATSKTDPIQLRSLTLHCKAVGSSGLTSGSERELILAPAGTPTTNRLNPDLCTQGRPARALKVAEDIMRPTVTVLFDSWIIVGVRLVCAQPVIP